MTARPLDVLTEAEHEAMRMTADLWDQLCSAVVRGGSTRAADLNELAMHVHAIQHAIMAQAAARAYPDLYRPLGGTLRDAP
jgi:transposase